jgi:hypothetical protein
MSLLNFKPRPVHSDRLERWLGPEQVDRISRSMVAGGGPGKPWYGPPIHVQGVPGEVWATSDGDFIGHLRAGAVATRREWMEDTFRRRRRHMDDVIHRWAVKQMGQAASGYASLSDFIFEMSQNGKVTPVNVLKAGTTGVVGGTNSLWRVGSMPAAGTAAAAAPGGTQNVRTTQGALPMNNPPSGDYQFMVVADPVAAVNVQTLLAYDRIFSVLKTMNSTATEAVTGVPLRYQNTTPGTTDSAEGNFVFPECGTVLPATAHSWNTCQYTDQGGTTGVNLPSVTGNSANIVNRLDIPINQWFCPLATGDSGIKNLTQMQCSAAVATGAIDFVIGHPIAWLPCALANGDSPWDVTDRPGRLVRIFDDACIAFLEVLKSATTATTYNVPLSLGWG